MRKYICAVFVVLIGISFAFGETEFLGIITKIEDGKVAHFNHFRFKKGKQLKEGKLALSERVKIFKGSFNKNTKMFDAGELIAVGLNPVTFKKVTEKGRVSYIITKTIENKEVIVEIRLLTEEEAK